MKSKKWTAALFIFYLAALTWIIVFKFSFSLSHLPHLRNINLIPFGDSAMINGSIDIGEIVQNFLVFVPYGLLIAILREKKMIVNQWFPVILTSFLFEGAQFIFAIGASDITDLIMNSAGGFAGILIARGLSAILPGYWKQIINAVSLTGAVFLGLLMSLTLVANI